jgi:hypothetical protein
MPVKNCASTVGPLDRGLHWRNGIDVVDVGVGKAIDDAREAQPPRQLCARTTALDRDVVTPVCRDCQI